MNLQPLNADHDFYADPIRGLMHRCRECCRRLWYATDAPQMDNGFVPATQPIAHLTVCKWHPTYKGGAL